jgi:HPt (histidine-containing phosphotransfer) domain-containing protein
MRNHCKDMPDEDWKKAARRLKGSAANLGEVRLSAASAQAEEGYALGKAEKTVLLETVQENYLNICNLIQA